MGLQAGDSGGFQPMSHEVTGKQAFPNTYRGRISKGGLLIIILILIEIYLLHPYSTDT